MGSPSWGGVNTIYILWYKSAELAQPFLVFYSALAVSIFTIFTNILLHELAQPYRSLWVQGTVDTELKVPFAENPQLSEILS